MITSPSRLPEIGDEHLRVACAVLEESIDLSTFRRASKRKNAYVVAIALLLFADMQPWLGETEKGFSVRDLYSALHSGAWQDLSEEEQAEILRHLVQEVLKPESEWCLQLCSISKGEFLFRWERRKKRRS